MITLSEDGNIMVEGNKVSLKRKVTLFGVTVYGIGNILGAGIYALIGEVVGLTGNLSWFSFIIAALIGGVTGLSYAELSAMYPKSAAEFVYVEKAFKNRLLSFILGWIIIFSGLLSAATVSLSFGGYLSDILGLPQSFSIIFIAVLLIIILSIVNFIGIKESTWVNIVFTLIEASGLILIIFIGLPYLGSVNYLELPLTASLSSIFSSVALIFFAYIGFEDIANIAEEVKDPERNLPRAIIYSIIITTVIYCLVSITVVSIIPYSEIAASPAPLNTVASAALGPTGGLLMSLIALFSTANTVLIILIVTSRMMYGMARDKALPEALSQISPKHHTPHISILVTLILAILFVFLGDITIVANATVIGVLITFLLVNLSVIMLRKKNPDYYRPFKIKPSIGWVPLTSLIGAVVCVMLMFTFEPLIILIQFVIIVVGVLLFYIIKRGIKLS
ncbi:MAG: APC family permease [Candidatus Odinarchaeia archaeon]